MKSKTTMKTIDQYLNELPEPERTLCLEARAKAKERYPHIYGDAQTAKSTADAIMDAFGWGYPHGFRDIYRRAEAGEYDEAAPKKMAADPVAERMEAMFADLKTEQRSISDRLDALRMEQYALSGKEHEQDAVQEPEVWVPKFGDRVEFSGKEWRVISDFPTSDGRWPLSYTGEGPEYFTGTTSAKRHEFRILDPNT